MGPGEAKPANSKGYSLRKQLKNGALERTRTSDPQLRKLMLYPLSYERLRLEIIPNAHLASTWNFKTGWYQKETARYSRKIQIYHDAICIIFLENHTTLSAK